MVLYFTEAFQNT